MTDYEVYDKFFADEEYELENAPSELYSYRSGWNTALKRASILIRDEVRPQGKWIVFDDGSVSCSICKTGTSIKSIPSVIFFRYCPYCGAKLRGEKGGRQ